MTGATARVSQQQREAGRLFVAFAVLAMALGMLIRPGNVTSNRSGEGLIEAIAQAAPFNQWDTSSFPLAVFTGVNMLLPVKISTMAGWDLLVGVLGALMLIGFSLYFSRNYTITIGRTFVVLVMCCLAGTFIFMLNKDVVQTFVFAAMFLCCISHSNILARIVIISLIAAIEYVLWRPYYAIVAVFVPLIYIGINEIICRRSFNRLCQIALLLLYIIVGALVFSYVLRAVKPDAYSEIVLKHSDVREAYTTSVAASGIKSLISVDAASPPYLFVLNWMINTLRLLLPVELLAKGPSQWAFAAYQLAITYYLLRGLTGSKELGSTSRLVVAVVLAFALASGTFEPDFGSWVRHETAALPFLMYLAVCGPTGTRTGHVAPLKELR